MKRKKKSNTKKKMYKKIEQHLDRGCILKSGNCIIGKGDSFGRFLESGPRGEYAQLSMDNDIDTFFDGDDEYERE